SFYTFIDKTAARDGLGIGSPEFGAQIASDGRPPFPEVEEDHVLGGVGVAYNLTEHTSVEVTVAKKLSYSNSSKDTQIGFALNFNF
ncbi:MAG: hypothetical protein HRT88_16700, partial [Lentisphaeraceae bacterium]|nr:hypothetical protein [Lentisphaeraceae bacterium]